MSANYDGSNLLFIACQPRSGSTLLQRILGAHSSIHTASEPWLMLHPLYALRENGLQAEYDASLSRTALRTFLDELPKGQKDYIEGIRRMYAYLYGQALKGRDEQFFLDKTPRYYLILPELKKVFPEARLILLLRNPLAVLSSVVRTWVGTDWLQIVRYKADLLEAPDLLLKADDNLAGNIVVRYEELVQDPKNEVGKVSDYLGLEYRPEMVEYGKARVESQWTFGDPKEVYEHTRPKRTSLEKWARPDGPQEWRLLRDYAEMLGEATFDRLGYDYEHCMRTLEECKPPRSELHFTFSLSWLLDRKLDERSDWRYYAVQAINQIWKNGMVEGARYVSERLKRRTGFT